jgi:hypothetical protein
MIRLTDEHKMFAAMLILFPVGYLITDSLWMLAAILVALAAVSWRIYGGQGAMRVEMFDVLNGVLPRHSLRRRAVQVVLCIVAAYLAVNLLFLGFMVVFHVMVDS